MFTDIAKTLIVLGIVLIVVGVILSFAGKIPGFGRLPGDILIKKDNFTFFFPITTSILISIVFSIILLLWNRK